jgi:hypothetical protein
MLSDLDNLLRHLCITQVSAITDEAQVRFRPPDQDRRQFVENLTVGGGPPLNPGKGRVKQLDTIAFKAGRRATKVSMLEQNLLENRGKAIAEVEGSIGQPGAPPKWVTKRCRACVR